jgi:hypothetical protein
MRRLPAPRRVRHCRAGTGGWCAWTAPLPVQGTPRTVPAEITGDAGARRASAIPASYRLVT